MLDVFEEDAGVTQPHRSKICSDRCNSAVCGSGSLAAPPSQPGAGAKLPTLPLKKGYADLFEIHGDGAWSLGSDELITFFRKSDKTSDLIGRRQAGTFKVLAALAGHGETPVPKPSKSKTANSTPKKPKSEKAVPQKAVPTSPTPDQDHHGGAEAGKSLGLSVRIEINLPADGSKETYDNIFKSIKENLLNG